MKIKETWLYQYLPQRAVTVLVRSAFGPALWSGFFLVLLVFLNQKYPTYIQSELDSLIVDAAIEKSLTLPFVDILMVGDSSCMMGVNIDIVSHLLNNAAIGTLCNIGYVGPANYATLIDNYFSSGRRAKTVIIMLDSIDMNRNINWDLAYKNYNFKTLNHHESTLNFTIIEQARQKAYRIISQVIYHPLPGNFGLYYGKESILKRSYRKNDIIEPFYFSKSEPISDATEKTQHYEYVTNNIYLNDLEKLGDVLHQHDVEFFLIVSPIASQFFDDQASHNREISISKQCQALKIPRSHVLDTPASMPSSLFSTFAHLSPWGRAAFSPILAKSLRNVIEP